VRGTPCPIQAPAGCIRTPVGASPQRSCTPKPLRPHCLHCSTGSLPSVGSRGSFGWFAGGRRRPCRGAPCGLPREGASPSPTFGRAATSSRRISRVLRWPLRCARRGTPCRTTSDPSKIAVIYPRPRTPRPQRSAGGEPAASTLRTGGWAGHVLRPNFLWILLRKRCSRSWSLG